METKPCCFECGTDMEKGARGFFVCPNCKHDMETDYLKAMFRLSELLPKLERQ